jgi:hypothetical protein
MNGKRPMLVLMAPPQHGKTEQVKDFTAWIAGKQHDLKTMFASYSDELGINRLVGGPAYNLFPWGV